MVINDPFDAALENWSSEVHEKTKGQAKEPEISKHLFAVDRSKILNGFNLNQEFAFNQQIGPEAFIKSQPLEDNWDRFLPFYAKTPRSAR
jgi:hypothetical protein